MKNQLMLTGLGVFAAVMAGGCRSLPVAAAVDPEQAAILDRPMTPESGELLIWEQAFVELFMHAEATARSPRTGGMGPSLVAGDWLAIECAIAGGYWDIAHEEGTPAYAEVPESWFRLE
jgi:hypothetical protein